MKFANAAEKLNNIMIYICNSCKDKKELTKFKSVYRDGKWVVLEAFCNKCEIYMEAKNSEGFPDIIRTEPSLKK